MIGYDKYKGSRNPAVLDRQAIEAVTGLEIVGVEPLTTIEGFTTIERPAARKAVFRDRFDDSTAALIAQCPADMLWILPEKARGSIAAPGIFTSHPRKAFSALAIAAYDYFGAYWQGYEDADGAQSRWPNSTFMPGCFVHPSANIGERALVWPGVLIGPQVHIGRRAMIKANTVIGLPGFGVWPDAENNLQHLPHVGGVIIGDDVELGALNTICAGTILPTVVENNVKTDDHVHIAHNCHVGKNSQLTAHVELSGSTTIGANCTLSPNCSTVNGTTIGEGAVVGIAANVTKDVPPRTVVVGNPARPIRQQ